MIIPNLVLSTFTGAKPKLLDLFCGAGGASMGYCRAGFEVEGVDIKPRKHYPFKFHLADALEFPLEGYDAYHASPPCQRFSQSVNKVNRPKHPDYILAIRLRLLNTEKPYVIENVPRAPLINYATLCGSSFGLPIRRHRLFESNIFIPVMPCSHSEYPRKYPCAWNRNTPLRVLSISGGYQHGISLEEHKEAMGITWRISYRELSEAIPPVYTEYIGQYLLRYLSRSPGQGDKGGEGRVG